MSCIMSEKSVEDKIYLKYGLEAHHLREAISRHNLVNDPELHKVQ